LPKESESPRSKKSLIDFLSTQGNKKAKADELAKKKVKADLELCTFKPNITKTFVSKRSKNVDSSNTVPIHERLNIPKVAKDKAKQSLQEQKQKLDLQGCTFRPKVNDLMGRLENGSEQATELGTGSQQPSQPRHDILMQATKIRREKLEVKK